MRRSPRTAKPDEVQRQREAQIHAMRRQGIFLEEEYQDEIKFYMHEMEVSLWSVERRRWRIRSVVERP